MMREGLIMAGTAVKTREKTMRRVIPVASVQPDEYMVQCPTCKTLETLFFSNGQLIQNRRFYDEDGHIYHTCGSEQPCRIFKNM